MNEIESLLSAIEKRAEDSTKGPWESDLPAAIVFVKTPGHGIPGVIVCAATSFCDDDAKISPQEVKNCAFIAAARADVPVLVNALKRAMEYARTDDRTDQEIINENIASILKGSQP